MWASKDQVLMSYSDVTGLHDEKETIIKESKHSVYQTKAGEATAWKKLQSHGAIGWFYKAKT